MKAKVKKSFGMLYSSFLAVLPICLNITKDELYRALGNTFHMSKEAIKSAVGSSYESARGLSSHYFKDFLPNIDRAILNFIEEHPERKDVLPKWTDMRKSFEGTYEIFYSMNNINDEIFPKRLESDEFIKNLPHVFAYQLYKNFNAFSKLTINDVKFLQMLHSKSCAIREELKSKLDTAEQLPSFEIVKRFEQHDVNLLLRAKKNYTTGKVPSKAPDLRECWNTFISKLKELELTKMWSMLCFLFSVAWLDPISGKSALLPEDFDLLLAFKCCVTESA